MDADIFEKLPCELRVLILEQLNREDLRGVMQVFPSFRATAHNRAFDIARSYTMRDLQGDLLQDALAIVVFPKFTLGDVHAHDDHSPRAPSDSTVWPISPDIRLNPRSEATDKHLWKWARMEFPDPFVGGDKDTTLKLDSLCRHVWYHAMDFVSKASAGHLSMSYRLLPSWTDPSLADTDSQRRIRARVDRTSIRYPFHWLGHTQRQRIMRAFLRYELLCRTYRPIAADRPGFKDGALSCGCRRAARPWVEGRFGPFRRWDWCLLFRYRNETWWDLEEIELLASVREYMASIYVALATEARQVAAPADAPPEDDADNIHFSWEGAGIDQSVSLLATCGLGTLAFALQSGKRRFKKMMQQLHRELREEHQRAEPTNIAGTVLGAQMAPWGTETDARLRRQRLVAMFAPATRRHPELMAHPGTGTRPEGTCLVAGWENNRSAHDADRPLHSFWVRAGYNEAISHGAHRSFASLMGWMADAPDVPEPDCWQLGGGHVDARAPGV